MNILAVDDEPLMLWQLTENLKRIFEKPEYRVSGFDEVDDVMEWLDAQEKGSIAYAFLDIKLRGMSGIELAKDIRERSPETKVIFCTAYSDYAMEAFSVHPHLINAAFHSLGIINLWQFFFHHRSFSFLSCRFIIHQNNFDTLIRLCNKGTNNILTIMYIMQQ